MNDFILQLSGCKVGTKIKFAEERLRYTVQARTNRYLVCTKPFNPKRTVLYCAVDLQQLIRGPEDLLFGLGAETAKQCRAMAVRLQRGHSRISRRRKLELNIESVEEVAA